MRPMSRKSRGLPYRRTRTIRHASPVRKVSTIKHCVVVRTVSVISVFSDEEIRKRLRRVDLAQGLNKRARIVRKEGPVGGVAGEVFIRVSECDEPRAVVHLAFVDHTNSPLTRLFFATA